jgi:hypothetical protein
MSVRILNSIRMPLSHECSAGTEFSAHSVSYITILGCTLSIINQSAVVDSRTKRLISAQPVAIKNQSEWQVWEVVAANSSYNVQDPQVDGVSNAEYSSSLSADVLNIKWDALLSKMPLGQTSPVTQTRTVSKFEFGCRLRVECLSPTLVLLT